MLLDKNINSRTIGTERLMHEGYRLLAGPAASSERPLTARRGHLRRSARWSVHHSALVIVEIARSVRYAGQSGHYTRQ
jgi:hypothetical protein